MIRTTTRITSVSLQVADQDRALAFYTDTLGCELRADVELWPGARWVEVVPPGSDVSIALLTADGGSRSECDLVPRTRTQRTRCSPARERR